MKKFNRRIHKTMGSLPPQLFKYFDMADIKAATDEFNVCITSIANEFHSKLEYFSYDSNIKLSASKKVPIDFIYRIFKLLQWLDNYFW